MSEAQRAVDAWRRMRARVAPKKQVPTYDAYPSDTHEPEIRFYVEARDVRGRLRREYVYLDGYSVHQMNWKPGATRGGVRITDWFAGRMLEALYDLTRELQQVADEKKAAQEAQHND